MSKSIKHTRRNTRLILEELEPRRLFSGGAEGLIDSGTEQENDPLYSDLRTEEATQADSADSVAAAEEIRREIAFVDAGVDNYQLIVDDLQSNLDSGREIEVIVLERDRDGIEQISEALRAYDDLDAIHIISHGSDGSLELGSGSLDADSLQRNNLDIALWSNAFSDIGDILIYGCDLAASEAGRGLIEELGALTLTDVAASTDLTGAAGQGGDWLLEYRAGAIESSVAVSAELQQEYQHTLATYTVTTLADSGAGSLRQAIDDANASGGADTIEFAVAGTISLASGLPAIGDTVSIDATTAPGYAGEPLVILDGSSAGNTDGLRFNGAADGSSVSGLAIVNFNGDGIQVGNSVSDMTITDNWIGTTGNG